MSESEVAIYRARYEGFLQRIAEGLRVLTTEYLAGTANVDRIMARAKDPERFAEKAYRLDDQGRAKYAHPLTELQDQLGLRVVVFYSATVEVVMGVLLRYFQPIEQTTLVPESNWEFGYFGRHAVVALPHDVVPRDVATDEAPRFFEVQIKTLFQHAWSEANHDLGYKAAAPLSGDQQRRLAFAAAQAWGADRAFDELRAELIMRHEEA